MTKLNFIGINTRQQQIDKLVSDFPMENNPDNW